MVRTHTSSAILICLLATIIVSGCSDDGVGSGVDAVTDTTKPTLSFASHANNAVVSGTVSIEVNADDNTAVTEVELRLDGTQSIGVLTEAPFVWMWDSNSAGLGPHTLTAIAKDAAGNDASAQLVVEVARDCPNNDCLPEELSFVTPTDGDWLGASVDVMVEVSDDKGFDSIVIEANGTEIGRGRSSPFSLTWNTEAIEEGDHTLRAVATDTGNQSIETSITVRIDRTRPTIRLIQPEDRMLVSDVVNCEAEVSDNGEIASVQFGILGSSVSTQVDAAPWETALLVSALEPGEYTLLATARDQAGQMRQDARTIIVDRPPVVMFLGPPNDDVIREQVDVTIEASDDVGLERVELYAGDTYVGDFNEEGLFAWTPEEVQEDITLRAIAYDSAGQETTAELTVMVNVDPCDRDGDGFRVDTEECGGGDCQDDNFDVNPEAEDMLDDEGLDQNCDGVDGVDADADTFPSAESGGLDCDDTNPDIFPCPFDPPGLCTDRTSDAGSCGACGVRCDLGLDCIESMCTCTAEDCTEGDPEGYDFDRPATFFHSVALAMLEVEGEDLDDDGTADNAFGVLMDNIDDLFQGNINSELNLQIQIGELALGASWPTLDADTLLDGATGVQMDILSLVDTDDNPATRSTFLAGRDSFLEGYRTPRTRFLGGSIEGNRLTIGPTEKFFFGLPIRGVSLRLALTNARIQASISHDFPSGIRLTNARLSGVLTIQSFADAVNEYLQSDSCSCLGLEGPMIDLRARNVCSGDYSTDNCAGMQQGLCTTIAVQCSLFLTLVESSLDIDSDGDGELDSMSALLKLSGQGTDIQGVAPEESE